MLFIAIIVILLIFLKVSAIYFVIDIFIYHNKKSKDKLSIVHIAYLLEFYFSLNSFNFIFS